MCDFRPELVLVTYEHWSMLHLKDGTGGGIPLLVDGRVLSAGWDSRWTNMCSDKRCLKMGVRMRGRRFFVLFYTFLNKNKKTAKRHFV